ncbi:MAG: MarR family transcriptional regulator [Phototrophicaceae bacterium]
MSDKSVSRDVARKAKRIFPLMGRMMEAQMRVPTIPVPPVHFHVLNRIDYQPHTLTELADVMSVSAASLSRTITVLEERGWVLRQRSEEDRRVVKINITDEGHQILAEIETRTEDFLADTLAHLSASDLAKLMDGLDILIGAFSDQMSHVPSDIDT